MEFPKEFEERMRALPGVDFEAFAASMDTEPVRAFRINTLASDSGIISYEELGVKEQLSFCREGYIFEGEHIGAHPLHHAGAIYVQEPAAMAVAECTEIEPGMRVLDLCASPGGKSTQVAAKLCGSGLLLSNEIDRGRSRVLASNIERMGVRNAVVTNSDSAVIRDTYPEFFDLVIVDAPCSGEGMMRKNPLAVSEWSIENVEMCARRQREILENGAACVRKGGRLIYSTCTFAPEENEMQIADFLSHHKDFRLVAVSERVRAVTADGITQYGDEMKECRRFYPHFSKGEGQFMALLLREGCQETAMAQLPKRAEKRGKESKEEREELEAISLFLREVLTDEGIAETEKYKFLRHGGEVWLAPDMPLPSEKILLSPGACIGHLQKGRIIPHHGFFKAYGALMKRRIELDSGDDRIKAYLHGESIRCENENGFGAVLCHGAVLGGVKITSGEAKNYYPKGLRS